MSGLLSDRSGVRATSRTPFLLINKGFSVLCYNSESSDEINRFCHFFLTQNPVIISKIIGSNVVGKNTNILEGAS